MHLSPQATSVRVTTLLSLGAGEWRLAFEAVPDPSVIPFGTASGRNSATRWYLGDVNGDGSADFTRQLVAGSVVYAHTLSSLGTGRWSSRANQE